MLGGPAAEGYQQQTADTATTQIRPDDHAQHPGGPVAALSGVELAEADRADRITVGIDGDEGDRQVIAAS